jgi:hypothetical protein
VNLKLILKAVKIREEQITTMLAGPMTEVEDAPDYSKIKQLSTVLSDFDQHFSSLSDAISDVMAGSCDSATLKREAKVWQRSLA